jgi:hypothetical protein
MTGPRRWARLFAVAASVAVGVGLVVSAYHLSGLLPRAARRQAVEFFLRGVLVGYAAAFLAGPLAVAGILLFLVRERGRRRRHPRWAKAALLGVSCLVGLGMLETLAAAWEAWSQRLPILPTRFPVASSPGTIHVVVIGGSSALGEPYRPWLSMGQILTWQLQRAMPVKRFELTILARLGACLEDMHRALRDLHRRPDVLVIYSGHNEFVARYEEERDIALDERPPSRLLSALYDASLSSPFCRLTYRVVSRNRLDGAPPAVSRHRLIDPPQCSPSEYAEVRGDFARRLEAIVGYCERIACLPLLVIPPSNEGGLDPSRSVLPPGVGRAEREAVAQRMLVAGEAGPGRATAIYAEILARHPGFAEAHFRLARLLRAAGRVTEANRHYIAARDADGLPIRCPTDFQDAYREVARRHPRAILIDGPTVLRESSPDGILGDERIQDAHHPTLIGYVALADAALRALHERRALGWTGAPPARLDPSECARHFGMDAARWATVCERTSVHYRRIAGYRFDPTLRLARARSYAEAARRIAEGTPPETAGVIGLGAP